MAIKAQDPFAGACVLVSARWSLIYGGAGQSASPALHTSIFWFGVRGMDALAGGSISAVMGGITASYFIAVYGRVVEASQSSPSIYQSARGSR